MQHSNHPRTADEGHCNPGTVSWYSPVEQWPEEAEKKKQIPKSAEEIHFATAYGWPWLAHHHHHRIPYSLENPENVFPIVASCIFGHCTMRRDESRKAY